jgi:NADH-quinone oxidoreductase subunit M
MLLSGIMLKMGIYGVIRWLLPVVPLGVAAWGNTAIVLSIIGILYAACVAIVQTDYKRLIAYSSFSHVGLISAGVFAMNMQGMQGSMVQMFSHGINVFALFFIIDLIEQRTNTRKLSELGGIRGVAPGFATVFMIVMLASCALPLTNGFIGEFLLINGIYQYSAWMAAIAGLTVILGAVYMLRSYQQTMLGEANMLTSTFTELTGSEKFILYSMIVLIFVIGIYPQPLLNISEPAVRQLLEQASIK